MLFAMLINLLEQIPSIDFVEARLYQLCGWLQ